MARRGRPKETYKFRNFEKTYQRYRREYYKAALRKYKKERAYFLKTTSGEDREMIKHYYPAKPNKTQLKLVMEDTLLKRSDFKTDYKSYKKMLAAEDNSGDPIQYIVANQAYEQSYKQYRGFKRAMKDLDLEELAQSEDWKKIAKEKGYTDLDLKRMNQVSEYEFRSGNWKESTDFYKAADIYYWLMKEEAKKAGEDERAQWQYAKQKVSEKFFDRPEEKGYWGNS